MLAQAAISTLSIPGLEEANFVARGAFTLCLVISLLAAFFTCVQHRELLFVRDAEEFRIWLSDGKQYKNETGRTVLQSSMNAHQLLNAPYELVGIAITCYIVGLGVYLGSAYTRNIGISVTNGESVGNMGVLVAFIVGTTFCCAMFGSLMGKKSAEYWRDWSHLPLAEDRELGRL